MFPGLFCCSDCSTFGHLELFQLGLVSFQHTTNLFYLFFYFLSISSLSSTIICSRLILYFPWHSPGLNNFLKVPNSFYWRNQDLGTDMFITTDMLLLLGDRTRKYICILTYVYIHICISIATCLYTYF